MNETALMKIRTQFLCQTPVQEIHWKDIFENRNENLQTSLMQLTINSDENARYPLKADYQRTFIKHIMKELQKRDLEIQDSTYEAFGKTLNTPVQDQFSYKHYEADNLDIVLKENVNIISQGTTGLCSWQAAAALSEWILNNRNHFKGKKVLELGSGVGLTGLILALHCSAKSVYLTDCHTSVLANLSANVSLNIIAKEDVKHVSNLQYLLRKKHNHTEVGVLNLPWAEIGANLEFEPLNPDIILAADVVYDSDLFKPLLNALQHFLDSCHAEALLACTERNANTLNDFLTLARERKFVIDSVQCAKENYLTWSQSAPIKIYKFKKVKLVR